MDPRDENLCPNGWMMIEQFQVLHCRGHPTARDAIKIMATCREVWIWDGAKLSLVIDKNEGWIFDICGSGPFGHKIAGNQGHLGLLNCVPDDW